MSQSPVQLLFVDIMLMYCLTLDPCIHMYHLSLLNILLMFRTNSMILFLVATPMGKSMLVEYVCHSYEVSMSSRESMVNLMVLDMADFDVILGMDWLASYCTTLDCHNKTMKFDNLGEQSCHTLNSGPMTGTVGEPCLTTVSLTYPIIPHLMFNYINCDTPIIFSLFCVSILSSLFMMYA